MRTKKVNDLARAFSQRTSAELKLILIDVLTPAEVDDLCQRLEIIKKLRTGASHREVAQSVGVSISRVTRGSKALQNSRGGFDLLFPVASKKE